MGEVAGDVVWIGRSCKIRIVALVAIGKGQLIISTYVAGLTCDRSVFPRKREMRCIVIK